MNQTVVDDALQHEADNTTVRFLDTHQICRAILKTDTVQDRAAEFVKSIEPDVYVTAAGGFPIIGDTWCGHDISFNGVKVLKEEIRKGLGASAVLTYMNRSNASLDRLADICLQHNHDWAYHWMTLTLLFVGYENSAEWAFSRDGRFRMSWPVTEGVTHLFAASASLKDWLRYTRKYDDKSFDAATRVAMARARRTVKALLPGT